MEDCIFCKIIRNEITSWIVDENDEVISFITPQGHPLVVTKKHVENIYELDDKSAEAVMKETVKIAKAVKKSLNASGVNIVQNNEPAAGQEVMHFHLHVKPRFSGDNVTIHISHGSKSDQEKTQIADKIKSVLE